LQRLPHSEGAERSGATERGVVAESRKQLLKIKMTANSDFGTIFSLLLHPYPKKWG